MAAGADPTSTRGRPETPATASPAESHRPADAQAGALLELECGDAPERWAALGFAVDGGSVRVGPVTVRCDGAGGGLRGWTLSAASASDGCASCDGIPTQWSDAAPGPLGEWELDHVVVLTDDLDRTVAALVAVGGDERRRAEPPGVPAPMAFVRLGAVIVEVVQGGGPTRLWGLTAVVDDVGSLPADLVGAPRDAVQRGRRIVTVRREAGLQTAVAFMTPRVRTRS